MDQKKVTINWSQTRKEMVQGIKEKYERPKKQPRIDFWLELYKKDFRIRNLFGSQNSLRAFAKWNGFKLDQVEEIIKAKRKKQYQKSVGILQRIVKLEIRMEQLEKRVK